MRIITLEEHITTPAIVKASEGMARTPLTGNAYMQSLHAKLMDLGDGRIADMDAAWIPMQVLSISASPIDRIEVPAAQSLARDANDLMAAAVKAHPDRFAA